MRAYHAEPNAIKADEIAARQLHALKQHCTGSYARYRSKLLAMKLDQPN